MLAAVIISIGRIEFLGSSARVFGRGIGRSTYMQVTSCTLCPVMRGPKKGDGVGVIVEINLRS
jgi:hypothetical protein